MPKKTSQARRAARLKSDKRKLSADFRPKGKRGPCSTLVHVIPNPGCEMDSSRAGFLDYLLSNYSQEELRRIQSEIYLNPFHIEYYMMYHEGRYSECIQYLDENFDREAEILT